MWFQFECRMQNRPHTKGYRQGTRSDTPHSIIPDAGEISRRLRKVNEVTPVVLKALSFSPKSWKEEGHSFLV